MSIFSFIRQRRHEYEQEFIPIVDGYEFSQKEVVERATKYWASEYDGDKTDPIIGELIFDNKVIEPTEKEAEATDFDMKDIEVRPKRNSDISRYKSMVATKVLREYMEQNHFPIFLNQLCLTRAMYGGVIVKDTDQGPKVVPWHNLITDQADIMSSPIIERHYYTPAELKKMEGKWDNIDEAIKQADRWRNVDHNNGVEKQESQGYFIEVYEIHGVLRETDYDPEGDPNKYKQRMMVVAGIDWNTRDENGDLVEENGLVLYQGEEKKSPYKYNARNAIPGRGLGVGVIESLFNTQKFHNFTLNEQLRMMSIAGKVFFDSDNPNVPANLLTELDHGTVLKRERDHSPLTQVNAVPSSLPAYDNLRAELAQSARGITGAHESVTGEETKSGTPFRLLALQNIEGHSRYEQEREEIGEFIEEIIREFVLPRALKWATKEDELYTHFDPQELLEIDELIVTKNMNRAMVNRLLNERKPVTPEFMEQTMQEVRKKLSRSGTRRLVKSFKQLMDDIEGDVRISTTAEHRDKAAWFESRANLIQVLDPADPRRSAIINSIMDEIGITPEELRVEEERMMQQQQSQQANVEFNRQERQAPAQQVA